MVSFGASAGPVLPLLDGAERVGVASCAASFCHGRSAASGSTVRQNEIATWQDDGHPSGAHARAYRVLESDLSRVIAARLGLGPAHEAQACLACHADPVPASQRGPKSFIDEGVTCEACHGGAATWIDHVGTSHLENLARGLYPTADPTARAKLCVSCHFGSTAPGQFVDHRMMAAGHPRMSFELDLFTALQSHHDEDADYAARKTITPGAKIWAIGQAIALQTALDLFARDDYGADGAFPEFVFFDCRSCHRPIFDDRRTPTTRLNPVRPNTPPGAATFSDANMIMLIAIARVVAPQEAQALTERSAAFHLAMTRGRADARAAADSLRTAAAAAATAFEGAPFDAAQTRAVLERLVSDTASRTYTEYQTAEQTVMAVHTLIKALEVAGGYEDPRLERLREPLEAAYARVDDPNGYDQAAFETALAQLAAAAL